MRCKFYSFDMVTLMTDGVVAAITNRADLKSYHSKATDESAYGLDLGYWTPRRSATPGTALDPNVYLVLNAEDIAVVNSVIDALLYKVSKEEEGD